MRLDNLPLLLIIILLITNIVTVDEFEVPTTYSSYDAVSDS